MGTSRRLRSPRWGAARPLLLLALVALVFLLDRLHDRAPRPSGPSRDAVAQRQHREEVAARLMSPQRAAEVAALERREAELKQQRQLVDEQQQTLDRQQHMLEQWRAEAAQAAKLAGALNRSVAGSCRVVTHHDAPPLNAPKFGGTLFGAPKLGLSRSECCVRAHQQSVS